MRSGRVPSLLAGAAIYGVVEKACTDTAVVEQSIAIARCPVPDHRLTRSP